MSEIEKAVEPVAVPDGWKLVPVDPTEDMLDGSEAEGFHYSVAKELWQIMLDTSPVPPALTAADPVRHLSESYDEKEILMEAIDECAEVAAAQVMKFRRKAGGRYYPGYHEDMRDAVKAAVKATAPASPTPPPSTDLREENERLENEAVLRKAAYDGVGSLLLEVQQDCIAEHNRATTAEARITELDEEIACLNAELATINFDLEDLKELADLREHSKQMAESGQDDAEARAEAAGTIVTAQAARIAELEAEVMELRRALGLSETLSKAVHKQAVEAENLVEKVHAENAEAKREARILAQSMWQQSYSDVTSWQMLDDTAGIITQISNMAAGIRDLAATLSAENTTLKETLEKLKRMAMQLRGEQAYREFPKAVLNAVADALSRKGK